MRCPGIKEYPPPRPLPSVRGTDFS